MTTNDFKLKQALMDGHVDTVKRMIRTQRISMQHCVNPQTGWNILFYAIRFKYNDLVEYLLELGHDDNGAISHDLQKNTALMVAVLYDNMIAFALYLAQYTNAADMENILGQTPLLLASKLGRKDFIEMLLQTGVDLNHVDTDGCNALHHAVSSDENYDCIALLISQGCNFALQNNKGWAPLDFSYNTSIANHLQECARLVHDRKIDRKHRVTRLDFFK